MTTALSHLSPPPYFPNRSWTFPNTTGNNDNEHRALIFYHIYRYIITEIGCISIKNKTLPDHLWLSFIFLTLNWAVLVISTMKLTLDSQATDAAILK